MALILVILMLLIGGTGEMATIIPGERMGIELFVIYIIAFILGPIIGIFLGVFFGPFFLFLQKKILVRKMIYGIQDRPEEEKFKKIF